MPTRVGLVGLGKIAQDQHVPVIAADPDFELAAVVSSRGASEPGIPTFRTLGELIASGPPVDAVSICTPPGVRHAIAREALEAGLPVLLEKPPAMTLTECADLVEAAESAGVPLFATWHSQYNAAVRTARERLAGKRLKRLHIHWHESVRKWHPGQEWIWQAGGFGVFDPGINALSIVTRITPEPLSIQEAELLVPTNRDTPIAATLRFRSLRGGEAELTGAFDWRDTDHDDWTIAVETTDGDRFVISDGGAHLKLADGSEVDEPKREYEAIYRRWADLLAAGRSDVEVAPLRLVADAFLNGRIRQTDVFEW